MKEDWILVVVKAFEDDAGVLTAETEGVGHRDLDFVTAWFIRHVVQVALRVRVLQVDRRVNDPMVDAEDGGDRFDSTGGTEQYFAWLTALPVGRKTVEEIAEKGGRARWKVENEGFNRQKNSGLNLEHVYSTDPEKWKVYYLLLQIAFLIVQLLERGSLLRRLAAELGRKVWELFGSLKNLARRLLESMRYVAWEDDWFTQASGMRIGFFDTS